MDPKRRAKRVLESHDRSASTVRSGTFGDPCGSVSAVATSILLMWQGCIFLSRLKQRGFQRGRAPSTPIPMTSCTLHRLRTPILTTCLYTGILAKEIKFVRPEQIDFVNSKIYLRVGETKEGDAATVTMNDLVKAERLKWAEITKRERPNTKWFFHLQRPRGHGRYLQTDTAQDGCHLRLRPGS